MLGPQPLQMFHLFQGRRRLPGMHCHRKVRKYRIPSNVVGEWFKVAVGLIWFNTIYDPRLKVVGGFNSRTQKVHMSQWVHVDVPNEPRIDMEQIGWTEVGHLTSTRQMGRPTPRYLSGFPY